LRVSIFPLESSPTYPPPLVLRLLPLFLLPVKPIRPIVTYCQNLLFPSTALANGGNQDPPCLPFCPSFHRTHLLFRFLSTPGQTLLTRLITQTFTRSSRTWNKGPTILSAAGASLFGPQAPRCPAFFFFQQRMRVLCLVAAQNSMLRACMPWRRRLFPSVFPKFPPQQMHIAGCD